MFCKQCGCQIPADSMFCENCGTRIDNVPAAPQQAAPAPAAAPQPAAPVQTAVPVAEPAAPQYQAVPVTPVYPPNSVYARNAYEAIQAQQAMMQQPQFAQVPQPVYQPYASATPMQQYQAPVYTQPLPGVLYDPNAAPAGSNVFLKILRIASGISTGFLTLMLMFTMISNPKSGNIFGYFFGLGYAVFLLIFSLTRKKMGKGTFIALIIPLAITLYLASNLSGSN